MQPHKGQPTSYSAMIQDRLNQQEREQKRVATRSPNRPVEIEALVLIKIMRHCRENFPTPVNGLLIGLDGENVLEITECFSLQNKRDLWNQLSREKLDTKDVDEKVMLEDLRYQMKMIDLLISANADCCNVGWYQTLQFDDLKDQSVIEGLCEHQELIPDAIMIGYDPLLASLASEAFRAFRITDEFLHMQSQSKSECFKFVNSKHVLAEVPLIVKNSLTSQAFLLDWFSKSTELQKVDEWNALIGTDQSCYFQKSLDFISGALDDLQVEQEKVMRYHRENARAQQKQKEQSERRRIENEQRQLRNEELLPDVPPFVKPAEPPSQLPTALLTNHIERITQKLSTFMSDNVSRSVLLHKELFP